MARCSTWTADCFSLAEDLDLMRRAGASLRTGGSRLHKTLLFRGARRLGFSVWARPRSWRLELERMYMLGLLALYRPLGASARR